MRVEFDTYLDGGTIDLVINGESYCFDERLKTDSAGLIFNGYPNNKNDNIYPDQEKTKEKLREEIKNLESYIAEVKKYIN